MSNLVFINAFRGLTTTAIEIDWFMSKDVRQTKIAEALSKACRQGYKNIMSLCKGNNDLLLQLLFLEQSVKHAAAAVVNIFIEQKKT